MAAQTPVVVASTGTPLLRLVVYALYGVTTNDTVSVASEFKKAVDTWWVPVTGTSVDTRNLTIGSNTTITLSPANITVDDGYLVVFGASAQQ